MEDPVKNIKWAKYPLGDITQWYGENEKLYTKALKDDYPDYYKKAGKFVHSGIDIVRPYAERLYAVDDGYIAEVKKDPGGYGKHIKLHCKTKDKDIEKEWVYGHLAFVHVQEGQEVKGGDYIGNIGNSGFVISGNTPYWGESQPGKGGTHLHLGCRYIKNGRVQNYYNGAFGRVDPLTLLRSPKLASSKVLRLASRLQDKTLLQLYKLLVKIGL